MRDWSVYDDSDSDDEEYGDKDPYEDYEDYEHLDDEMVDHLHADYVNERNRLISVEMNQSNLQDVTLTVVSLSGYLINLYSGNRVSGLFFTFCIVFVLISYQFSQKALKHSIDFLDGYAPSVDNSHMRMVPYMNYLAIGCCAIGLICGLIT